MPCLHPGGRAPAPPSNLRDVGTVQCHAQPKSDFVKIYHAAKIKVVELRRSAPIPELFAVKFPRSPVVLTALFSQRVQVSEFLSTVTTMKFQEPNTRPDPVMLGPGPVPVTVIVKLVTLMVTLSWFVLQNMSKKVASNGSVPADTGLARMKNWR